MKTIFDFIKELPPTKKKVVKKPKKTKSVGPLKDFVIVVWDNDEAGEYSPQSFPVKATSRSEVLDAIENDQEKINGKSIPHSEWFLGEDMPKYCKGKVYTLKNWSKINWAEFWNEFDLTSED